MSSGAPLPLETYVLVLAHLLRHRGESVAAVLGSLNVPAEAFKNAEEHYTRELSKSFAQRKGMMAMTFAAAFAEARKQVGLFDEGEGAPEGARPSVRKELPSHMLREAVAAPAPLPAIPLTPSPPLSPPVAAPAIASPATPPPPVVPPPFAPPVAASPTALPPSVAPLAPASPAAAPPPATHKKQTAQMAAVPNLAADPLPFAPGIPGVVSGSAQSSRAAPANVSTGTAMMDPNAPLPTVTPWQGAESLPPLPSISLEWFASLAVELMRKPPEVAPIFARYGVRDADEHKEIDAAFRAHFRQNPALRAKYEGLVVHYAALHRR